MVEDDEVPLRLEPSAPQVIGAGQTSLTSADHHDVHLGDARVSYPDVVHAST
ncbi:hypothetical protein SMD44_08236 [Streptomyces alboflavus]|uniref:Uncharacterized protein n=1 Tax=Streptomyces alboflavus TaxID=67267 RepID=A0A1Z1WQT0_9ACTN|nr:hypothetical protein SMD44_08236 [Streptomyces alboflavus]